MRFVSWCQSETAIDFKKALRMKRARNLRGAVHAGEYVARVPVCPIRFWASYVRMRPRHASTISRIVCSREIEMFHSG
jgi:hypothetical protein